MALVPQRHSKMKSTDGRNTSRNYTDTSPQMMTLFYIHVSMMIFGNAST